MARASRNSGPARVIPLARVLLLCLGVLWASCAAAAEEGAWETVIAGHEAAPPGMIAVDKKRQQIFLFERHSPLRLKSTYICTTGQATGDKMVRGDLKTPEGVYFVVQHLTSGLDFTMYGKEAYTLNYPNPVDRLRSKTGYGIWIHGRGEPIAPLQTQGCIAMNNPDLTVLGSALPPGTPVVLTASFSQSSAPDPEREKTVRALVRKAQAWSDAWGSRSSKMFAMYDAEAYSQTTESFSAFKAQKERLFKSLPWIKTSIKNVQVLEGPGYWVTWFQQDYAAPNLSTNGVRRLYWRESDGELRIVGMEWVPGMTTGTLLASAEPAIPPVEAAPRTEEQDDRPLPAAVTVAEAAPKAPAKAESPKLDPPKARAPKEDPSAEIRRAVETWRKAWEKGDLDDYMACYASNASQGGRSGADAIRAQKEDLWKRKAPAKVVLSDISVSASGSRVRVRMRQEYADATGDGDKGVKTLTFERQQNAWRITREDWSAR